MNYSKSRTIKLKQLTVLKRHKMKYHIFGEYKQWAISEDDGCLRFHPQFNTSPEKKSSWIWKEAFEEVERMGGYENVLYMLRCKDEQTTSGHTRVNVMRIIEEVQNRAFAKGLPKEILTSTTFVDYIRGLFPEYYITLREAAERSVKGKEQSDEQ